MTVTALSAVGIGAYRVVAVWTPLQRHYLRMYVWTGLPFGSDGSYELWSVVTAHGRRLAVEDDLVSVTAASGERSFDLSDEARVAGATQLSWESHHYHNATLHAFLARWIYARQSPVDLVVPSLWGACAVFVGGVLGATWREVHEMRRLRERFARRESWRVSPAYGDRSEPPWDVASPSAQARAPMPATSGASPREFPAAPASSDRPEWWAHPVVK